MKKEITFRVGVKLIFEMKRITILKNSFISKTAEPSNVHLKKQYFENRLRLQYNHKSEIDITKPNLLAEQSKFETKQILILPKPQVKKTKNHPKMRRHSSVELYSSDIPVFPAVVQSYRYQCRQNGDVGGESSC